MNSKKMGLFGVTILSILTFKNAQGQPAIGYNNNTFSIVVPPIDMPNAGKSPYTKVFLEVGSGPLSDAFFILKTDNYQQQQRDQQWYFKETNANQQSVAQLSYFYDTIRRPPHAGTQSFSSQYTLHANSAQNFLVSNTIAITNAVNNTILPLDTMTIALTYKNVASIGDVGAYDTSVIAFFYNSTGNATLFRPIPADNTPYHFSGGDVNPVRLHNGATLTTFNALPGPIKDSMIRHGKQWYSNALYFFVPYRPNDPEKNIFISMAPSSLAEIQKPNGGSYKAVIIDYNNSISSFSTVHDTLQNLVTNLASHDPNHILTTPACLAGNSPTDKKIDYEIEFENDGKAPAQRIQVTVTIPRGIKFPDNLTLFTCRLGNTTIPVYREGAPILVITKDPRYCLYKLNPLANTIIFTMPNARLSRDPGQNGQNNIGRIKFSTKTEHEPTKVRQCMNSTVLIKFDKNADIPASSLVRINCNQDCFSAINTGAGN